MIRSVDLLGMVPRFLKEDRNGRALAKALEAGVNYFIARAGAGLAAALGHDVDACPEWRLDELAWEYDCLYDETAPVEMKRTWIENAWGLSVTRGTPGGLEAYLEGYFGEATVEEWWEYGGEAYHFRVSADTEYSQEKDAWARKAIERGRNARSVLDAVENSAGKVTADEFALAGVSGALVEDAAAAEETMVLVLDIGRLDMDPMA